MKKILSSLSLLTLALFSHPSRAQFYSIEKYSHPSSWWSPTSFLPSHELPLLIGTHEGVLAYDKNTDTFVKFLDASDGLKGDTAKAILRDNSGALWIETENGVSVKSTGGWTHYLNDYDVPVRYSLPQQEGSPDVWMIKAGWELQLTKFSGATSTDYSTPWVNQITGGTNGEYYKLGDALFKLGPTEWTNIQSSTGLGIGHLHSLCVDNQNTVYVGTYQSFLRRKVGEINFTPIDDELLNNYDLLKMRSDQYGRVFLLVYNDVLMLEHGKLIPLALPMPANTYLEDLKIDKDGSLYLLSHETINNQRNRVITKVKFLSNETQLVKGILFNDLNADGVQGNDEPGVANHVIKRTPGGVYAITSADGSFLIPPVAGTNTITWQTKPFWGSAGTPTSIAFQYPEQASETFHIGIQQQVVHDVAVSINGWGTRPGFPITYNLTVSNEGSIGETPVVTLQYDPDLDFQGSEPSPTTHTDNTLTWNLSVASQRQKRIDVNFITPVGTPLGTDIFNLAMVNALAGEDDVADNTDSLRQTVTGSFDPNDKLVREGVLEEGYVKIGSYLTYTIRFQNTGTDTAFTVRVRDMIDAQLDITSLEILSSSHPMETYLEDRQLTFLFKDILLPDSVRDEPKSHGFIKYRIKNKEGIVDGTDVTNTADIYFDFNEPVVTNTVSNRYVQKVPDGRIQSVESDEIDVNTLLYPNPARGFLKIKRELAGEFVSAKLISPAGRIVGVYSVVNGTIDLEYAQPGFYMMKLEGRTRSAVAKIILVK